jgi:hypothetical protein
MDMYQTCGESRGRGARQTHDLIPLLVVSNFIKDVDALYKRLTSSQYKSSFAQTEDCEVVEIKSVAFIELDRCCCEALAVI